MGNQCCNENVDESIHNDEKKNKPKSNASNF